MKRIILLWFVLLFASVASAIPPGGGGSWSTLTGKPATPASDSILIHNDDGTLSNGSSLDLALTTNSIWAGVANLAAEVSVAEQTVVGRKTGGVVDDLAIDSDLAAVSASDDTVPSAKATKAMGDLKIPYTTKFTQCVTIKDPVATSDHQAWRAPQAITITNMHCLATGGTSLTGQFQEGDANGANLVDVDSDMTCTAGSNVNDDGTLTNGSIDAGDYVYWKTTSVSGTQTELIACFDYTIN